MIAVTRSPPVRTWRTSPPSTTGTGGLATGGGSSAPATRWQALQRRSTKAFSPRAGSPFGSRKPAADLGLAWHAARPATSRAAEKTVAVGLMRHPLAPGTGRGSPAMLASNRRATLRSTPAAEPPASPKSVALSRLRLESTSDTVDEGTQGREPGTRILRAWARAEVAMPEIVNPKIEGYLKRLYDDGDPVRREMEELARQRRFPIVGPLVGRHLLQLALAIGARRVFELGSGYGYSALFFARGVGESGTVHCTDLSEENVRLAEAFLTRAGVWGRITY